MAADRVLREPDPGFALDSNSSNHQSPRVNSKAFLRVILYELMLTNASSSQFDVILPLRLSRRELARVYSNQDRHG